MGKSLGGYRAITSLACRALGRYRSGRAGAGHRTQTRADDHAAQHGVVGVHSHRTDACDYRSSVPRHDLWTTKINDKHLKRVIDTPVDPANKALGINVHY